MPLVTSVEAGITGAGSVGGAPLHGGHCFWVVGFDDGTSQVLEAGPSGPLGTGDLVTQNYGGSGAVTVPVSDPNFTTAGLGQALLGAYGAYSAGQNVNPVQYSMSGGGVNPYVGNSNSYFSSEGTAVGLSQSTLNNVVDSLQNQSGLEAYGADNFGISDRFAQIISGGDDSGNADWGDSAAAYDAYSGGGGGGGDEDHPLMC